jgi:hypothetical protein
LPHFSLAVRLGQDSAIGFVLANCSTESISINLLPQDIYAHLQILEIGFVLHNRGQTRRGFLGFAISKLGLFGFVLPQSQSD